jgi:pyruvate/2-oxoacid:ferredoxin oxidoreductase alpha subunit
MLKQIEGSRAVAEAVAMCRPQVICAYPITPQTHIVEALSAMVKKEESWPPSSSHPGPLPAGLGQFPGGHGQGRPAGH